jgi:hypothetical protein
MGSAIFVPFCILKVIMKKIYLGGLVIIVATFFHGGHSFLILLY